MIIPLNGNDFVFNFSVYYISCLLSRPGYTIDRSTNYKQYHAMWWGPWKKVWYLKWCAHGFISQICTDQRICLCFAKVRILKFDIAQNQTEHCILSVLMWYYLNIKQYTLCILFYHQQVWYKSSFLIPSWCDHFHLEILVKNCTISVLQHVYYILH